MENNKVMLINAVPVAAHLREVVNFNPKKFLQRGADPETGEVQMQMQLRYKKLWFRLAFPNGSMNYRPIRVTDQTATYEAAVYLDRNDERPISAFTVTRSKEDIADGDFVKAAQEAALDTALDDAGFGIQLCEVDCAVVEPTPAATPNPAPQVIPPQAGTQTPPPFHPPENTPQAQESCEASAGDHGAVEHQAGDADVEHKDSESAPPQDAGGITAALGVLRTLDGQGDKPDAHPDASSTVEDAASGDNASQADHVGVTDKSADSHLEEQVQLKYTNDMTVEDICARMTPEEAGKLVVSTGINIGWTLAQIAEERPSSLKFYAYLDDECGNVIKAGALILIDAAPKANAS